MIDFSKQYYLVVDDFQGMRTMLRDMLREMGAQRVDIAASGGEAIGLLNNHRYDVILCDYNLGSGRTGQQLLEESKVRNLIGPACAWIMVTAEKTSDAIIGAVEYQPDAYLIKPVTAALLETRLEKIWARKAAMQEIDQAMQAKDFSKAVALCERRLVHDRANAGELQRLKSQILINAGKWDKAREVFEQVLAERELPWAKTGLAKVYFQNGDYAGARDLLQQTVDENRTYLEAYDWLAKAQQKLGDADAAENTLGAALRLWPNSPVRQKNLAELALKRGDTEKAEQAYRKSVVVGEHSVMKSADAYLGLAKVVGVSKPDEALKTLGLLQKQMDGDDIKLRAKSAEGMIYHATHNLKKVEQVANEVDSLLQGMAGKPGSEASIEAASLLLASGRRETAVELLQSVVRNNHENRELLNQVQQVFIDANMAEEGATLVEASRQEAIELMNRGVLLAREGKIDEAVESMYQARAALPANVRVLFNFAYILITRMQQGDAPDKLRADARNALLQANRLAPGDKRFNQLMDALVKLQPAQ